MLGKQVFIFPHPRLMTEPATLGFITRDHGDGTVDVIAFPDREEQRRASCPAVRSLGPIPVADPSLQQVAGYRGSHFCQLVMRPAPELLAVNPNFPNLTDKEKAAIGKSKSPGRTLKTGALSK